MFALVPVSSAAVADECVVALSFEDVLPGGAEPLVVASFARQVFFRLEVSLAAFALELVDSDQASLADTTGDPPLVWEHRFLARVPKCTSCDDCSVR